jgi:hypothetical protein
MRLGRALLQVIELLALELQAGRRHRLLVLDDDGRQRAVAEEGGAA